MRIAPRLAAALGCLALAAGCGDGATSATSTPKPRPHDSTDARQVRMTVEHWLASLTVGPNKGNDARACAYLTHGLQRSIDEQLRVRGEKATCKTFAAEWTGGSTPPGRPGAHVTGVVVTGATAHATLTAPPDRESDVSLRRIGGRWLIENY